MAKSKTKEVVKVEEKTEEKKVEVEVQVKEPQQIIQAPTDFKSKMTKNQIEIIKSQVAKGASDDELKMFLYVCQRTGLDPFTKQVHLVPRWDGKAGKEVRSVIVGIDGLRSIAEKTGAYAGNTDPIFEDGKEITFAEASYEGNKKVEVKKTMVVPTKATATVKKIVQGLICDFTATAKWDEYYPGDKSGMMWRKMPDNMLGKCAEAKALRKAFPAVMSGLFVEEEMHQAGIQVERTVSLFQKAKEMITSETNKEKLESYKAKISGSDKYDEDQKNELVEIINSKI